MALKRLDREITKVFPNKMNETLLPYKLAYFDVPSCTSNIIAEFSILENSKDILHLSIPSEYPFKPPTVWVPHTIANKRYDRWSADLTGKIIKLFNKNKTSAGNPFLAWIFSIIETPLYASGWKCVPFHLPLNCLCCESISCSGNWGPSHTIVDLLIEYLARRKFAIYCSPLWQKRISSIFNNDRWILPDDIIFNIVQYLNIPARFKLY